MQHFLVVTILILLFAGTLLRTYSSTTTITMAARQALTHIGQMFQLSHLLLKSSLQGALMANFMNWLPWLPDVPIFPLRYGASFNAGIGLEKLTARNWEDYVDVAVACASRWSTPHSGALSSTQNLKVIILLASLLGRPREIARIRQSLNSCKSTSAFFDTEAFASRYAKSLKMLWETSLELGSQKMHVALAGAAQKPRFCETAI